MKFMLKPPGSKRSKLTYEQTLSNVAFKFKLRRYSTARTQAMGRYQRCCDCMEAGPRPGFRVVRVQGFRSASAPVTVL